MKLLLALLILGSVAHAAEPKSGPFFIDAKGKEITKLEAMRTLITQPDAVVIKCQAQEMSNKGTLRNKKRDD